MSSLIAAERPNPELSSSTDVQLRRLIRPFQRYWRTFLTVAIALSVLGALAIVILPRTYTAEVRLIAGNPNRDATDLNDGGNSAQQQTSLPILNALTVATGLQTTQTYAELMQETPVAQRAIDDLNLRISPDALLSRIHVAPINDTPMLSLKASWSNPQMAATIANTMATAFVQRERDLIAQQADAGISFIAAQLPAAEQQVRGTNQAVARFMAGHHLTDATTQSTQAATNLDALDQKIAQAEVDRRQSQAQLSAIQSELGSTPQMIAGQSVSAPNPVVEQLRQQLSDLQVQLADNAARFTNRDPMMQQLHRRIADLQRRIASLPPTVQQSNVAEANAVAIQLRQQAAQLGSQIQADSAAEQTLVAQRKNMIASMRQLPGASATLSVLERRAKLAQDAYYAMLQKYNELMVAKSTALSDVTVTQPASASNAVPTPSLKLGLLAAALLALAAAFVVVLLLDVTDNRIGDERDVRLLSDMPTLGRIDDASLAIGAGPESRRRLRMEAAYDEVLDAMRFATARPPRTIAILSPSRGDGKTTAAINLALGLAEREGPVLLVDADFRSPDVHKQLRLPETPGLSDVLEGRVPVDDAIRKTAHHHLDVLTSGTPARNPVETLEASRLRELLQTLAGSYASIVVDTCALNAVHDALEVARAVDASLLVIAAGWTRAKSLATALERLSRAQVPTLIGYVLNRAQTTPERLAYYETRPSPVFPVLGP
jgi:succinoglycan biosynthesis transport protein ExoP